MSGPSIEDEWQQMARAGAIARRKKLVPIVVGCALFLATTMGVFLAMGKSMGEAAEARKKELADEGYVEIVRGRGGRQISEGEQTRNAGAMLFLVALGAGLAAGAAGFFALGGKVSSEYSNGLKRMS